MWPAHHRAEEGLQFVPVEVLGGGDLGREVVELLALAAVILEVRIAAAHEKRFLGGEVLAREGHQFPEDLVEAPVVRLVEAVGQGIAARQDGLVLFVEACVADAVARLPLHAVGH
jgi:hypothetical protein